MDMPEDGHRPCCTFEDVKTIMVELYGFEVSLTFTTFLISRLISNA